MFFSNNEINKGAVMLVKPHTRPELPESTQGLSGTLLRGLRIIETLAEAPTPLTLAELSERAGFDNSTAHRLVQLLVDEGYVSRVEGTKRYSLGPRSVSPLAAYHPINNLIRDTYETLQSVRDETGETVSLIMNFGTERVIVNLVQGRENLPTAYGTWLRNPLHGSASGKSILMTLSALEMRELLGPGPLPAATEFTTTDIHELVRQIEEAKTEGFVIARDDAFVGLTAIGAPISRNGKGIASLVIAGSSARLTKPAAERCGHTLARAANLITNVTASVPYVANFLGW
jgi:DNA-binding IclR family transcriptional regulator